MSTFYHTGDLGDIIAALPVIRHLGGGELFIGNHPKEFIKQWGNDLRWMKGERFDAIKPLLSSLPYIRNVRFTEHKPNVRHDFTWFRTHYQATRSLMDSQAAFMRAPRVETVPWLRAAPASETRGKFVIARSGRYHNAEFPWPLLIDRFSHRMIFVGLKRECDQFNAQFRATIPHRPTRTLMELAQLIAGSSCFIGNQSCPCWIAMGLGVRLIQESFPPHPDSIVPRSNAMFVLRPDLEDFRDFGLDLRPRTVSSNAGQVLASQFQPCAA